MSRYSKGKDGRFTGSVGAGKDHVPSASHAPVIPSAPQVPAASERFRAARIARAAAAGRQLVFGPNVKACQRQVDPAKPFISVAYVLDRHTDALEVEMRLRDTGRPVRRTTGDTAGSGTDVWIIDQAPGGKVQVISPLIANTAEGWASAERVQKKIRGTFLRPGARITLVEAEAGALDR